MHRLLAPLLLASWSTLAWGQLGVDRSVVELSAATPRATLSLRNSGADTLYVNLSLEAVDEPGRADAPTRPVTDPLAEGLLVQPRQMILAPGQGRSARVLFDGESPAIDRTYRLVLEPFAGEALVDAESGTAAGVRVLLGYRLPLFVRPDRPRPDVSVERASGDVRLVNRGNTNVLLRTLEACEANGRRCTDLAPARVHPGAAVTLDLPPGLGPANALIRARQSVGYRESLVEYAP